MLPIRNCDKARDYTVPNVLSQRDIVFRPDLLRKTDYTHNRNRLLECEKAL